MTEDKKIITELDDLLKRIEILLEKKLGPYIDAIQKSINAGVHPTNGDSDNLIKIEELLAIYKVAEKKIISSVKEDEVLMSKVKIEMFKLKKVALELLQLAKSTNKEENFEIVLKKLEIDENELERDLKEITDYLDKEIN